MVQNQVLCSAISYLSPKLRRYTLPLVGFFRVVVVTLKPCRRITFLVNTREEGQSRDIDRRGLISGPWIWTEILGEFVRF